MLENNEIWRDCKGYEGKYQVSNKGRVWSIRRQQYKAQRLDKDGYFRTTLTAKNGKNKTESIHRLVALAFLPREEGKNVVNHIDSNRQNNCVENLEWTDNFGNMRHGYDFGNLSNNLEKATEAARLVNTKTYLVYKNNELVATCKGVQAAARVADVSEKTVRNCIRENRPARNGYSFALGGD